MNLCFPAIHESIYHERLHEMQMPDPPTHCTGCGRPLIYHEEVDGYYTDGSKGIIPTWRCPRTLGWRRLWLSHLGHDEYEPDRFGDKTYWHKREYR